MDFFSFPAEIYALAFFVAAAAGFFDSVAGGGGLISVPFLLNIGVHPIYALATNKLQAMFGTGTAVVNYFRHGAVKMEKLYIGIACTLVGAVIGTLAARYADADVMSRAIPFLMIVIVLYFIFYKYAGPGVPKMPAAVFYVFFGLSLGFYDGFFGPGTGSLWTAAMLFFIGFNLTNATANTKVFNFVSNVTSMATFAQGGLIHYDLGLVMACGQMFGAYAGSRSALKKGAGFIRLLLIISVSAMIIKLFYDNYA